MIAQYKKKPVTIEAAQIPFEPEDKITPKHFETTLQMLTLAAWCSGRFPADEWCIYIPTKEGIMRGKPGDFIICGVAGEFYPCDPDIFTQTYESVICGA